MFDEKLSTVLRKNIDMELNNIQSEIKIVNYQSEWESAHQEFARLHYNNRRKRVVPEYIYWKFRGHSNVEAEQMLLAVSGNKVVGQLGLIPCKITIEGDEYHAHWACDLMVGKEYRGKGLLRNFIQKL